MEITIEFMCNACFTRDSVNTKFHPADIVECKGCHMVLATLSERDFLPYQIYCRIVRVHWRENA